MRWSRYFIPTLKEAPSDAEAASHRLMTRAGLIRKAGSGSFVWLPMGVRVLRKLEALLRNGLVRENTIEVSLPVPGDTRKKAAEQPDVFTPPHLAVVADVVRSHVNSYRQLPLVLFQIQARPTGEARPRAGVLYAREALMLDAYAFARDEESLPDVCARLGAVVSHTCRAAGLPYVTAHSAVERYASDEEFAVLCDAGETVLALADGGSAANADVASVRRPPKEAGDAPGPLTLVDTPGAVTIKGVSGFLKVEPRRLVKTLIYLADGRPVAALVRGDHEVNEFKLRRELKCAGLALADAATIERVTNAPVGFAGPIGLAIPAVFDYAVDALAWCIVGGNKADAHFVNAVPGRDFPVTRAADIHAAAEGDVDPASGRPLQFRRGIELAHVMTLDARRPETPQVPYFDEAGKSRAMAVGFAAVALSRIVASLVETSRDDAGIIWPKALSPFDCEIVAIDVRDEEVSAAAESLYTDLAARGIDVLYDDRDASPGNKFHDADLVGVPLRATVGKRSLKKGGVELKRRDSADIETVPLSDAAARIAHIAGPQQEGLTPC